MSAPQLQLGEVEGGEGAGQLPAGLLPARGVHPHPELVGVAGGGVSGSPGVQSAPREIDLNSLCPLYSTVSAVKARRC